MITVRFTARHLLVLIAFFAATAALLFVAGNASAQGPGRNPRAPAALAGTAFTYQGQLKKSGALLTSTCNFTFTLFADSAATMPIGSPSVTTSVGVANGLFTAQLNSGGEFGSTPFNGDARWLRTAVQCTGDGSATTLNPLQRLTPAPMAFALPGLYTYQNPTSPNIIGGYSGNVISNTVVGGTIGGGGANLYPNRVWESYATVGGGANNIASGGFSTISGGDNNAASGLDATVGGGGGNTASNQYVTIGGGAGNTASNQYATVGGGNANTASSSYATIGGGNGNTASGYNETVGGGNGNTANGGFATIGGGLGNNASGLYATIPGGSSNVAVTHTLAAGRRAQANHQGSFVWADCNPCAGAGTTFASTADNQFLLRANGGMGVNTASPVANTLTVGGSGLRVATDGTTFARIQAGETDVLTSTTFSKVYTVTFPVAFSGTPKVIATARNDPGYDVGDTFVVAIRKMYSDKFVVNIVRVDTSAGWAQHLMVDWIAWE